MTIWEAIAIAAAGVAAGVINTVVGSGTLITFPTLLAFGIPPVLANATNTVGLSPGSVAGAWAYRDLLAGRRVMAPLVVLSVAGGAAGGTLLLALPAEVFGIVAPILIAVSCVAVVAQPRRKIRRAELAQGRGVLLRLGVFSSGIYGGYFGAGQGVVLVALLGWDMQRVIAVKNLLAACVNLTAGAMFVMVSPISWRVAALIAGGSVLGARFGGRYARGVSNRGIRAIVAVVGVIAIGVAAGKELW
jgi:uncharacterized protein